MAGGGFHAPPEDSAPLIPSISIVYFDSFMLNLNARRALRNYSQSDDDTLYTFELQPLGNVEASRSENVGRTVRVASWSGIP